VIVKNDEESLRKAVSDVDNLQQVMFELEFEWIRPFWVQGRLHSELNSYWTPKITKLESVWKTLQQKVRTVIDFAN
jgi:hypothetical protein